MGSALSSSCLPSSVAHSLGLPDENDMVRAKYQAAKTKLEEGIYLLTRSEENMDLEIKKINQEVVDRSSSGDKAGAMMAFKSKKIKEKQRDKTRNTRTRLETQLDTLFQSQFNGELHNVLKECNTVMQSSIKKVTPEEVQKTMDDLEDAYNDTEEISQALSADAGPNLEQEAEDNLYDANAGEGGGKSALEMELEEFLNAKETEAAKMTNINDAHSKKSTDSFDENHQRDNNYKGSETHEILSNAPLPPPTDPYLERDPAKYQFHHTNEYIQRSRQNTGYPYIDSVHAGPSASISGKKIIKSGYMNENSNTNINGPRTNHHHQISYGHNNGNIRPISGRVPIIKPSRGPSSMQPPPIYKKSF